jgi:hypothetical protein
LEGYDFYFLKLEGFDVYFIHYGETQNKFPAKNSKSNAKPQNTHLKKNHRL